eukprot:TRINITY_DN96_c0_g1_i1.p1 TRINITY_DN96_c0_g1~~TRINITY_DN96_c0_g1_i1.p1  ORF type:complete len:607 (+),score=50.06 TRINITY_DN96_c0_g1_i1:217-1821(+)
MNFMFHIPKTAGRTFNSCFWKSAVPPQDRCSRAYDWLHLDENPFNCKVMASHDDYSILRYLPNNIAYITVFRHPVSRFISAYEFSLEVAIRSLGNIVRRGRTISNFTEARNFFKNKVQTRSVWPWMYIVPELEQDARNRTNKLKQEGLYEPLLAIRNATRHPRNTSQFNQYDNPFYMSLEKFMDSKMAFDLIHNGAAFQLLGITNNTHGDQEQAALLRECSFKDENSRKQLAELAKRRLQGFFHIGLTERVAESLSSFAADKGWKWEQKAFKALNVQNNFDFDTEEVINSDVYHNFSSYRKDIRLRKEFQYVNDELVKREVELNTLPVVPDNHQRIEELLDVRTQLRSKAYDLLGELSDVMYRQPGPVVQIYIKNQNISQIQHNNTALHQAYYNCLVQTNLNDEKIRNRNFYTLTLKDGRGVALHRKSRKNISPELLEKIKQYNLLDSELYDFADKWLDNKIAQQKEQGIYQEMPPQDPGLVDRIRKQMAEQEKKEQEERKKKQEEERKRKNQEEQKKQQQQQQSQQQSQTQSQ